MQDSTYVSIVMPVYNAESYLDRSISSVLKQTNSNWELIAVDDGSIDRSRKILQDFSQREERILSHYFTENRGAAAARNYAIKKARGHYLAFLDADDEWLPEKLERQIAFMADKAALLSCTAYRRFGSTGVDSYICQVPEKVDRNGLLKNNTIGTSSVMVDLNSLGKRLMPDLVMRQDYAYWLSLLKSIEYFYGLNLPLTNHHLCKSSLSSNKFKAVWETWKMFRYHLNLPLGRAVRYFISYIINGTRRNIKFPWNNFNSGFKEITL